MNLPEYMVDRNSAFEDIVFSHVKKTNLLNVMCWNFVSSTL